MRLLLSALFLFIGTLCFSQPGYHWAKALAGPGAESGDAITADDEGNSYTAGTFADTADFDPGPGHYDIQSIGEIDAYVCKLDASGNFVWARNIGGVDGQAEAHAVAVDFAGNVYITGWFRRTVDFDPGPGIQLFTSTSNIDIFVIKLNAAGNYVWGKKIGGGVIGVAYSIAVDATGNVFTTGEFGGSVDFDPGPNSQVLTSLGQNDIFVSKLDPSGNYVWAKSMGGTGGDRSRSIALDASGNIFIAGDFQVAPVDFDPGPGTAYLTPAGSIDGFVCKLNAAGNYVWAQRIGNTDHDIAYSVAVDSPGNVHVMGTFSSTVDFDPGPGTHNLTSAGGGDIFITKFDPSGNFIWAKSMGGTDHEFPGNMALDTLGNVYTTGFFRLTVDFDPGPGIQNRTATGANATFLDVFISKLDASGNYVWAYTVGGAGDDVTGAIAVKGNDNIYLTGTYWGIPDMDPGPGTQNLPFTGAYDIFVLHLFDPGLEFKLQIFRALDNVTNVLLQWQTIFDQNIASYTVEKSRDSITYNTLGSVPAANNGAYTNDYAYTDTAVSDANFYRLKMINRNGQYTYSGIVVVKRKTTTDTTAATPPPPPVSSSPVQLSPNPADKTIYVRINVSETVTLQIADANGRIWLKKSVALNDTTLYPIDIQPLPAGQYYLLVNGQQTNQAKAFLKK